MAINHGPLLEQLRESQSYSDSETELHMVLKLHHETNAKTCLEHHSQHETNNNILLVSACMGFQF